MCALYKNTGDYSTRERKNNTYVNQSKCWAGLDINVCPIPVKTDVGQVDLVLRLSDGQIYFHWYKILGLLYKRALFDLQFVHNSF
jgi:hypothetical protein